MPKWTSTGHGSYRKLSEDYYQVSWRDPDGKPRRRRAHMTQEEVILFLLEKKRARSRLKMGLYVDSWDEIWECWEKDAKTSGVTEEHIRKVVREWKSFKAFVNKSLHMVNHRDAKNWRNYRAEQMRAKGGSGAATANKAIAIIAAVFASAKEIFPTNPAASIKPLPTVKRVQRTLTAEEYGRLRDVCEEPVRDLFDFLLLTGCRFGEVRKFQHSDIHDRVWTLKKRKGGVPLKIPLGPHLAEIVMRCRVRKTKNDLVFGKWNLADPSYVVCGKRKPFDWHGPMTQRWAIQVLRNRCKWANVTRMRLHDFRHATASWLSGSGAPIQDISKVLGHSSVQMTAVYAHPDMTDAILRLQDRMQGMIEGAKENRKEQA